MKIRVVLLAALTAASLTAADPLAERIGHSDPARYQARQGVHAGAGEMSFGSLLPGNAIHNLGFLHRGVIAPKGGIGHHFHNSTEEMFLIYNGEAQFTIDGRTAVVKGPVGVPVRLGSSHAIYNHTDQPLEWMNISVRVSDMPQLPRGADPSRSFDLGDDRVGATLDRVPAFMTAKLYRDLLRPVEQLHGGQGTVQYRRTVGPSLFRTNWAYVDHLVLPAGATVGRHLHEGLEEFYYVIKGEGNIKVNGEMAAVRTGDAIPILAKEAHALDNTSGQDLEVIVVGVALEKGVLDTTDVP